MAERVSEQVIAGTPFPAEYGAPEVVGTPAATEATPQEPIQQGGSSELRAASFESCHAARRINVGS